MNESKELTMRVVISADGMLYCYDEKGVLTLVKPDLLPAFQVLFSFQGISDCSF